MEKDKGDDEHRETASLQQHGSEAPPSREMSTKAKYATTAAIYYCNIAFGASATFLAPILVLFEHAYNTDMATLAIVFVAVRVSLLVSALGFGFIFNYVNRHALVIALLFIAGVMLIIMPHGKSVVVFGIINVINAVALAGYATAQVVWVIEIWKEAAGPYIQGQHFFFALGCIFPSLIFAPFLRNKERNKPHGDMLSSLSDTSVMEMDISINGTEATNSTGVESVQIGSAVLLSDVYVPCAICGVMVLLGAIFLLVLFLTTKTPGARKEANAKNRRKSNASSGGIENSKISPKAKPKSTFKFILVALAAIFVGVFQAMEGNAFQYLPTYTHYSSLKLSAADGANMMSVFTISYTVSRLVGIFISFKVIPQILLVANILFVAVANAVLLIAGNGTDTHTIMLVGSILLGVGFSTSVPSVFDYVKMYMEITNVVGAILMVAGGVIAALFPIIVGAFIESVPAVVIYLNFASVALGVVTFAAIFLLIKRAKM